MLKTEVKGTRGGGLEVPRCGGAQGTPEYLAHCNLGVARYSGGTRAMGALNQCLKVARILVI